MKMQQPISRRVSLNISLDTNQKKIYDIKIRDVKNIGYSLIIIHAPKRGSIKFKVLIKILLLLHSFSLFPHRKQQAKRWPREQRPECKRFSKLFKLGSKLLCCFFFNILY